MAGRGDESHRHTGLAADYYESFNILDPKPMSEDEGPPPDYNRSKSRGTGMSQARIAYEPQSPFYSSKSPSMLDVPGAGSRSRSRPRSLPPPDDYTRDLAYGHDRRTRRERGHHRHGDSDDSDGGRTHSPIDKARHFVGNTFSDSTTGLGVGVLGALVGGLAAREVADYSSRNHKGRHHDDAEHKRKQLISTVVGAAVGALGANAVEKRIEINRQRDNVQQERWERKWRPEAGGRGEVIERREVVARPRSRRRDSDRDRAERDRSRGGMKEGIIEREVDPDARSWKNVEDWLWDDRDDPARRPRSSDRRSPGSYRY